MLSALLGQDLAKKAAQKILINAGFSGALSLLHRDALNKAMKKIIKELFDLLEYELGIDEDTDTEELIPIRRAVDAFLDQKAVQQVIISLLKEPQYQLDAAILAQAWQDVQDAPILPEDFSWLRISKRFSRKAGEIRDSIPELKSIFAQELAAQADKAVADSIGPQPDFDLETYAKALLKEFGRPGSLALASVDLDGPAYDAVRLWQVFVPQSVRECRDYRPQQLELPKGEEERQERLRPYFDQPSRPVLDICADQQLQRIVILGDPGSGKSSLLRFLALEWARDSDPNHRALAPVPLLIELRDYHSKRRQGECSDSFLSYMHKAYSLHRFNQNSLDALLRTLGRVLLLLDGLDEIFDRQEREQVISDIHRFSNTYKDVRIIVTSRVVGYEAHRLRDAEFRDFMLQDFAEEQIAQFLGHWHEVIFAENQAEGQRKQERLAKAIKDSKPIERLAGNPLLLTMMAIINRHEELPKNRFELYKKSAKLLLQQWDTEAKLLSEFPGLSAEIDLRAKSAILRKVALHMQTADGKAANLIEGERLVGLIEEYLHDELRFDQARAAANALVKQLRERNFILCFLGGDSYAFVHRTFLEYFCSAGYVHQFEKKRSLTLDDLLALYDAHCREDDWQEVLRLICGQLEEHKVDNEWIVGKIIEHLTRLVDLETWDKKTPLPELVLAVWCLSEVRNLSRIKEEVGGNLLLKVVYWFLQSRSGNSNTLFELPKAAAEVGLGWPGKYVFRFSGQYPGHEIHKAPPDPRTWCQMLAMMWSEFLAVVFGQRLWIEKLSTNESALVRNGVLKALDTYWPDDKTRQLLTQFAMQDKDAFWGRKAALSLLSARWSNDDETRQLLKERTAKDTHKDVRTFALELLAEHWPDEETRQLLKERTAKDIHEDVRTSALEQLARLWPDDETHQILRKLVPVEGMAASWYGTRHSPFGDIIFTRDLDGIRPYCNPRQPIHADHIQKAAKAAGIPPDKIDEAVRSLSAHMGWDITKGSLAGKL